MQQYTNGQFQFMKNYMSNNSTKESIEKQFNELAEKARKLYPCIDNSIDLYANMALYKDYVEDYFNLLNQIPNEISTNKIL